MRTFLLFAALTIACASAQGGIALTDENEMTLNLGLCPVFDYMACLRYRIKADEALKECESNADCDIDSGSFCCPSKCAGMRCLTTEVKPPTGGDCPNYEIADVFRHCKKLDYDCAPGCPRCCVDIETCSRRCFA